MNNFTTTLNIPSFHHSSLKRHEREVDTVVEGAAKRICLVKAAEERRPSQPDVEYCAKVDIAVSYDGLAENKKSQQQSHGTKLSVFIRVA